MMEPERRARINYYLRQYRKNLQKIGSMTGTRYWSWHRQASLSRKAQWWMKKAVKLGFDLDSMLTIYWSALN